MNRSKRNKIMMNRTKTKKRRNKGEVDQDQALKKTEIKRR